MEINVKKRGKVWAVQFTHGVQTFTLDYHVPTEEEAQWMKSMLAKCFTNAFGENWNDERGLSKHAVIKSVCECSVPGITDYDHGKTCVKCLLPVKQTVL